jgi:predicted metalloprotease with PDZ domain
MISNQVGLTLKASGTEFVVAAVASKNGKATVAGVQPGDKLIRIDGFQTKSETWARSTTPCMENRDKRGTDP